MCTYIYICITRTYVRVSVCVCAYIPISKTMSISHPMKYLGTPTLLQAHLERDARISCPTEINQLKAHGWEGTCCQGCDDKPEFVITSSYWQVLSIYNVQYILYILYTPSCYFQMPLAANCRMPGTHFVAVHET